MLVELRVARAGLIEDSTLRGAAFGQALSDVVDRALTAAAHDVRLPERWALVALGSYATRELCPGSDVDVMLLHGPERGGRASAREIAGAAQQLFYPLWDAGVVVGHVTRNGRDAIALADDDYEVLTSLLEPRLITGDEALVADLAKRARDLATRRRARLLEWLSDAASQREIRPGPIAEMLEPNLKKGAGGLRDLQALTWAGWTLGAPGGVAALVAQGYVEPSDITILQHARAHLLDVRVELHRVTGRRSDVLAFEDQDQLAARRYLPDPSESYLGGADQLVRGLAETARAVAWITGDVWRRLDAARRGPSGRVARRDRDIAPGVVVRDGEAMLTGDASITITRTLQLAIAAAAHGVPIQRATLNRLAALSEVGPYDSEWDVETRRAFIELLRNGRRALPVIEALDHVGAMATLLPEWAHVRALPQRNAYHRFTVDRHLLETVAECAQLLDETGFDGEIARRTRPELLLLGALLHDIAKGLPDDHSVLGADVARSVANRIGIEAHGTVVLEWLVRHHLLLADTATRRDLADEATIVRFGQTVRDTERLDLLYALTIGDSRATGPAAWSTSKADLCRQLFVETDTLLERGVVGRGLDAERRAALARHRELLDGRELAVVWSQRENGLQECAVIAHDRTGLLATVAGALAVAGFDVEAASAYGDLVTGMALELYQGTDRFGRLDADGQAQFTERLAAALTGDDSWRARLAQRINRYRDPSFRGVSVEFDLDASQSATVVEVRAADEVGLLATVTGVFAELGLDVSFAKVATLVDQVLDVFYVRDAHGAKITDPMVLETLRRTLTERVTAAYTMQPA